MGRQGGVRVPVLAASDQEVAVGWFVKGGECQGWDFSPDCGSRQSLAWRTLFYGPGLEGAAHLIQQLFWALLINAFMCHKKWWNPELLSLNQSCLHALDDTDPSRGPAERSFWLLGCIWSFSFSHSLSAVATHRGRVLHCFGLSLVPHREEKQRVKHQVPEIDLNKQTKTLRDIVRKIIQDFKWHLQTWVRSIFCETSASYMDSRWNDSSTAPAQGGHTPLLSQVTAQPEDVLRGTTNFITSLPQSNPVRQSLIPTWGFLLTLLPPKAACLFSCFQIWPSELQKNKTPETLHAN